MCECVYENMRLWSSSLTRSEKQSDKEHQDLLNNRRNLTSSHINYVYEDLCIHLLVYE